MHDKVSIVIPVYNGANYVGEAIDSALAQTYKNIEIIVINDGSTDNTEEIVASYGSRIRYFRKENGGVSSALNLGISQMTGKWFSWLSHDDLYMPEKIEKQIAAVKELSSKNIDCQKYMFYCQGGMIDANGNNKSYAPKIKLEGVYSGKEMLKNMFHGCPLGGCGFLIPKSMFYEVGFFDETMRYMQDVFEWEKAFLAGYGLCAIKDELVKTRIHGKQVSTTGKNYGLVDRERVGDYLIIHLDGLFTEKDNKNLLKEYLMFCLRNNSTNIAKKIQKKLSRQGDLYLLDRFKIILLYLSGRLRRSLKKIYYKIKYNADR